MARKYTGKYPNAARTVSAKGNDCTVITNAGAVLKFHGVEGAARLGFNIPKLGQDMSEHLREEGIATREDVEQRANDQHWELIRSHAPRFNVGDMAHETAVGSTLRILVCIVALHYTRDRYTVRNSEGRVYDVASCLLVPASRFLHVDAHVYTCRNGDRINVPANVKRNAHASDQKRLLGLNESAKLPTHAMPVRFVQGHAVYVISAAEAHDVGEFHRVRVICDECGAHVPAGRMHQHKCR